MDTCMSSSCRSSVLPPGCPTLKKAFRASPSSPLPRLPVALPLALSSWMKSASSSSYKRNFYKPSIDAADTSFWATHQLCPMCMTDPC